MEHIQPHIELSAIANFTTGRSPSIMPPAEGLLMRRLVADRYNLLLPLGRGRHGYLYEVENVFLKKRFALEALSLADGSIKKVEEFHRQIALDSLRAEDDPLRVLEAGTARLVTSSTAEHVYCIRELHVAEHALNNGGSTLRTDRTHPLLPGRFSVLRTLGQMLHGTLYEVEDQVLEKPLLVVVPSTTVDERSSRLEHAGLLRIIDWQAPNHVRAMGQSLFYILDLPECQSLSAYLTKHRPLDYGEAIRLLLPICQAVGYTHQQGFIYGSLQLENVVVYRPEDEERFKAQLARKPLLSNELFIGLGSSGRGVRPASPGRLETLTDIFHLGCILYEALTGRHPIKGLQPSDFAIYQKNGAILRLRQASDGLQFPNILDQILGKMLTRDPRRAYKNCEELNWDLHLFQEKQFNGISARWFSVKIIGNPKAAG